MITCWSQLWWFSSRLIIIVWRKYCDLSSVVIEGLRICRSKAVLLCVGMKVNNCKCEYDWKRFKKCDMIKCVMNIWKMQFIIVRMNSTSESWDWNDDVASVSWAQLLKLYVFKSDIRMVLRLWNVLLNWWCQRSMNSRMCERMSKWNNRICASDIYFWSRLIKQIYWSW